MTKEKKPEDTVGGFAMLKERNSFDRNFVSIVSLFIHLS
jgi:hypothetical protein